MSKLEYTIGPMRAKDFLPIIELFSGLGKNYTCRLNDLRSQSVMREYLRGVRKRGFVARINEKLIGVILFEITPLLSKNYFQIRNDGLVIDEKYRGHGIGPALLRKIMKLADSLHVTNYLIKASDPNVIKLYRKFEEFEERGVYFYYSPRSVNNAISVTQKI